MGIFELAMYRTIPFLCSLFVRSCYGIVHDDAEEAILVSTSTIGEKEASRWEGVRSHPLCLIAAAICPLLLFALIKYQSRSSISLGTASEAVAATWAHASLGGGTSEAAAETESEGWADLPNRLVTGGVALLSPEGRRWLQLSRDLEERKVVAHIKGCERGSSLEKAEVEGGESEAEDGPVGGGKSGGLCRLSGNVVTSRRQMRLCDFKHVVVVPVSEKVNWSGDLRRGLGRVLSPLG